jgi:hypothetical protein
MNSNIVPMSKEEEDKILEQLKILNKNYLKLITTTEKMKCPYV